MICAMRRLLPRLGLLLASVLVILVIAEVAVRQLVVASDGLAFTLMHQRWLDRYWEVNSLDYRDVEWTPDRLVGKQRILIIGDSFAAGLGIKNPDDRFAGVLSDTLGDNYAIMVAAKPGWDTRDEWLALNAYPFEPDIVILSYFVNDIEPAARAASLRYSISMPTPTPLVDTLISASHLLNYLYWNIYYRHTLTLSDSYLVFLEDAYQQAWQIHAAELQTIYDWTSSRGVRLIVVVFPELNEISRFSAQVAQVERFFAERNVAVVNLTEQWINYPRTDRVVSNIDAHPSTRLHEDVGEALAQIISGETSTDD